MISASTKEKKPVLEEKSILPSEKRTMPVAAESMTAKNRTPKTVVPNKAVPAQIVAAAPGPLS